MSENNAAVSRSIAQTLALEIPPVALARVDKAPQGVRTIGNNIPSACTFWRMAETEVLYAPASAHFNCPIGTMTMGFDMPEPVQKELMGAVEMMCGCGYISKDEPAKIPHMMPGHAGIVYGPLARFPIEPDFILLWMTPRQAMIFNEATGGSSWAADTPTSIFGRPACTAIPLALSHSKPQLSLGCMGMRTYTEIDEDRILAVLPAKQVADFCNSLEAARATNEKMRDFYEGRKRHFAG